MLEIIVLAVFSAVLFLCIGMNISILIPLIIGFILFFTYGLYKKHSVKEMSQLAFSGIKTVKNILFTFVLIGIITAMWRAGGTIPYIVYYATKICSPDIMILIIFLLCCLISFLTGTAFGTAATMGVICATMANSMGIPLIFTGGAILAGSFFGDRCSPMSTSALLVSSITKTNIFQNIINMVKTSVIPFLLTCFVYLFIGLSLDSHSDTSGIQNLFEENFNLHYVVLIPAIVIIVLSLFKINVKITMSISILCAVLITFFVQKSDILDIIRIMLLGYHPDNIEVSSVLSGGGIISMVKVFFIVCISSCYSGMFKGTGLLNGISEGLINLSKKITPYGGVLVSSVITSVVSCNQTLAIMLTHQLCGNVEKDSEKLASYLEDTVVIISPLIPWSIAAAVPLGSVGAPLICVMTAFYLYLIPIWNYGINLYNNKKSNIKLKNGS